MTYSTSPVLPGLIWSLTRTSAGGLRRGPVVLGPNNVPQTAGSIMLSTDKGATWAPIPNGGNVIADIGRATLATAVAGDAVVYAFAAMTNNAGQKDLYRSIDGGLNWTAIGLGQYVVKPGPPPVRVWEGKFPVNPNPDQPNMDIMAGQAFYNQMVLVDPADAGRNTVYIGGQLSAARSADGGATWRIITNWLAQFKLPYVHADHHAAAFASLKGEPAMIFGTDGGLFVSTDGGDRSARRRTTASRRISSTRCPATRSIPTMCSSDCRTTARAGAWERRAPTTRCSAAMDSALAWSQATDDVALASVYYSFIVRAGSTPPSTQHKWRVGWNGIAEFFDPALTYFNTALATPRASADPKGQTFFHRTRYRLYRTTNGAESWTCVMETPLATTPAAGASSTCSPPVQPPDTPPVRVALRGGSHPIGISPDDLDHFGVLANGGWFYSTVDGGTTWSSRILPALLPPGRGRDSTPPLPMPATRSSTWGTRLPSVHRCA